MIARGLALEGLDTGQWALACLASLWIILYCPAPAGADLADLMALADTGVITIVASADGSTWYSVHQHGAEATVTLALLATIAAATWLRHRRDLLVGTALLLVLLVAEYLLGRAGGGSVAVHVPLAMLLMGLAVWLPMAARRG